MLLMETRLAKDKGKWILEKCGFWNRWEFPREGLCVGLLLGWMPNQNLIIQYGSKHLVHTNLHDNKANNFSITFVYGQPDHAKREEVWSELKLIRNNAQSNWLCIGDFNQVLSHDDKFSFNNRAIVGAKLF